MPDPRDRQADPKRPPAPTEDAGKTPPAGPHAKPGLSDDEKTPGTGALAPDAPPAPEQGGDVDPGTG
jgi:hypothetical protein